MIHFIILDSSSFWRNLQLFLNGKILPENLSCCRNVGKWKVSDIFLFSFYFQYLPLIQNFNDTHHLKLTKEAFELIIFINFLLEASFFQGVRTLLNLTLKYGTTFNMSACSQYIYQYLLATEFFQQFTIGSTLIEDDYIV